MMDIRMKVKAKITGKIFEHNKIYNGKNKIQKEKDGSERKFGGELREFMYACILMDGKSLYFSVCNLI